MNMKEKLNTLAHADPFARVIIDAAKAQTAIDKAQQSLNERRSSVSGWLFDVARDEVATVAEFKARCAKAEEAYKSIRQDAKLSKQYSQAKSNIKAAMEFGLKLKDFNTESAMRKALIEARKAKKAKQDADKASEKHTALCNRLHAALAALSDNVAGFEIALLEVNEVVIQVEGLVQGENQEPQPLAEAV